MNEIQGQFTWQAAIRKSVMSSNCKLVLLMLSLYMNHITTTAWPSNTTLALDTGLSKRAVQRALQEARDRGFLVKEERFSDNHGQTSNLYTATTPVMLVDAERHPMAPSETNPRDCESPPLRQSVTPPVSESHPNKPMNKQLKEETEQRKKGLPCTTFKIDLLPLGVNGVWDDYIEHRKSLRKPLSETAAKLVVRKLKSFAEQGMDATAVLEQSIENGWAGVFAIKDGGHRNESKRLHRNRTTTRAIDSLERSKGFDIPDKL